MQWYNYAAAIVFFVISGIALLTVLYAIFADHDPILQAMKEEHEREMGELELKSGIVEGSIEEMHNN